MSYKMSSSVAMPFGETGVDCNNARGVVKMAAAGQQHDCDHNMLWLKESTVAGSMIGLHRYPGAAVMIPAKDAKHGANYFVNVHTYAKYKCEDGRTRYEDVLKGLLYGNVELKRPSSVSMILEEKHVNDAEIVIMLTSNHPYDCNFTVVVKTPGQAEYRRETVLGTPRYVDVAWAGGQSSQVWDWRFFVTNVKEEGYVTDRSTVWEVWTVIEGEDTHVFDINCSAV